MIFLSFVHKSIEYLAHPAIDQTVYMDALKKYHKTACTSLPEHGTLGCWKHVEDTIIELKQ